MNFKKSELSKYINSKNCEIYIGNKVIQKERKGKKYYDISLIKELFVLIKDNPFDNGQIFSISDFSNFQTLHIPSINNGGNNSKVINNNSLVIPYQNLKLFSPLKPNTFYVAHLSPLSKELIKKNSEKEIKSFIEKYNEKNLPRIMRKIQKENLAIKDWWYSGGEFMNDEDIIEIVSTYEENLLATLGAVYDGGYHIRKSLRKAKK